MTSRMYAGVVITCLAAVLMTTAPAAAQCACGGNEVCGLGDDWVSTCAAGTDNWANDGATVGIDTDLDPQCRPNVSLILNNLAGLQVVRSAPVGNTMGTDLTSAVLTGTGVTMYIGTGQGLARPTTGAITQLPPPDNDAAASYFDVFCRVDLGGGTVLYNQTAIRVAVDDDGILCVPPEGCPYFHFYGCTPLYDAEFGGNVVANLVSAEHWSGHYLEEWELGACCNENTGVCLWVTEEYCEELGAVWSYGGDGTVCLGDANENGFDDACEPEIPTVSEWGLIVMTLLLLTAGTIVVGRRRRSAAA
ncbi:MAG: IPTL-CTERM sorting domain-containing protein [bacterium]|nr:IPTL-CTERM sorting domain-containing protein [bacterium]